MIEIWKDIKDYEGLYQVSNMGRISNFKHIMKLSIDTGGYPKVKLCNKTKHITHIVHRLVAITFIPNQLNKSQVNHIDGNKLNNRITNLEWVTQSENMLHAYKNNLNKNTTKKQVQMLSLDGIVLNTFKSISLASKQTRINRGNISSCVNGNLKTAGRKRWQYA
jgi:hypothetical protein